MKFILVNGRTPIRTTFCLQCCNRISGSYLRDTRTRIPYCDYACYGRHRDYESRTAGSHESSFVWRAEHSEGAL
jgi:hypothetical protein